MTSLPTPSELETIEPAELPAVLVQIAAKQAELAALQTAVAARMVAAQGARAEGDDELLDVDAVAERLGMSKRWVYQHGRDLPFARKLGGSLRFSKQGLVRYLDRQRRAGNGLR